MRRYFGHSEIGEWITLKYFNVFGQCTPRASEWEKHTVLISTNNGLWRKNYAGYTSNPADAGLYSFLDAWAAIKDLGPEKHATLYKASQELIDREKFKHLIATQKIFESGLHKHLRPVSVSYIPTSQTTGDKNGI